LIFTVYPVIQGHFIASLMEDAAYDEVSYVLWQPQVVHPGPFATLLTWKTQS
jgi:DNA topoisomerase IA